MFDTEIMKKHCFHDSVITKCSCSSDGGSFYAEGDFFEGETEKSGLKYFSFGFSNISESIEDKIPNELSDLGVIDFEIRREKGKYFVKLCLENNFQFICLKFICENIDCTLMKFKGMSCQNVH